VSLILGVVQVLETSPNEGTNFRDSSDSKQFVNFVAFGLVEVEGVGRDETEQQSSQKENKAERVHFCGGRVVEEEGE